MSNTKLYKTFVDLNNPYLIDVWASSVTGKFIEIFGKQTILDIVGEAVELHFQKELNVHSLCDGIESLLLSFQLSSMRVSFSYVPYTQLFVFSDRNEPLFNMNLTALSELIICQVNKLIEDFIIAPLFLKPGEMLFIENVSVTNTFLNFFIKIVDNNAENTLHEVQPSVNRFF